MQYFETAHVGADENDPAPVRHGFIEQFIAMRADLEQPVLLIKQEHPVQDC